MKIKSHRVICSLLTVDSYFSSNLRASPIIRVDTLQFYAPCATGPFVATNAKVWARLGPDEPFLNQNIIDFRQSYPVLPPGLTSSSMGIFTLLSAISLRLADVRSRVVLKNEASPSDTILYPSHAYHKDVSGAMVVPLLREINATYGNSMTNPNDVIFWHNVCMSMTANLDLFEVAAGREGISLGRSAIDSISKWAQSSCARRACLHAAQAYKCMSRRKVADGTSFLSETALFNSALVLGLYVYTSPPSLCGSIQPNGTVPLELLDDIDWNEIGDHGFFPVIGSRVSGNESAATRFVMDGGAISFAGMNLSGGYRSSRKIMLEYVGLLEEVGKWKSAEFCRILRTMSDTYIDLGVND